MLGIGRLRRASVLVGALVILPALPGVASAARTKVLTAEYKGTYHFEDHFNSNGSVLNTVESYSWDEVETDTVEVSSGDIVRKRLSLVANGKLHQDATNGSSPIDYNCTIQQLKVPGDIRSSIVIEPDTHTGTLTGYGASVGLPDLAGLQLKVSGGGSCNVYSSGSSVLNSDNYTAGTCRCRSTRARARRPSTQPARSTGWLPSAAGPGPSRPPTTGPTTPKEVRSAALDALRLTISRAIYPCLTAGAGAVVFVALGLSVGPVVGGTMLAVAGPACARLIASLHSLTLIYDDPPVAGYRSVARVRRSATPRLRFAACPRLPASLSRLCGRLHSAAQAWLATLSSVSVVEARWRRPSDARARLPGPTTRPPCAVSARGGGRPAAEAARRAPFAGVGREGTGRASTLRTHPRQPRQRPGRSGVRHHPRRSRARPHQRRAGSEGRLGRPAPAGRGRAGAARRLSALGGIRGEQTTSTLANLESVLADAGAGVKDVVMWSISLVSRESLPEAFAAFQEFWGRRSDPPAISVVIVAGLANPGFLVEISAIAVTEA